MFRMFTDLKGIKNIWIRHHEKRRGVIKKKTTLYKKKYNVYADTEVRNSLGSSNNILGNYREYQWVGKEIWENHSDDIIKTKTV